VSCFGATSCIELTREITRIRLGLGVPVSDQCQTSHGLRTSIRLP
jgi:hypothetical protein